MIAPHIRKDRRGVFLLSLPIDAAGLPHADCVKNMTHKNRFLCIDKNFNRDYHIKRQFD